MNDLYDFLNILKLLFLIKGHPIHIQRLVQCKIWPIGRDSKCRQTVIRYISSISRRGKFDDTNTLNLQQQEHDVVTTISLIPLGLWHTEIDEVYM